MSSGLRIKDSLKYRPEIDGLRAIAVLAVVCFHFDLGAVSGGFVGVDIFFVISGFLISSIVLNQIESSRFSIAEFYARRARRILPALSVMLLSVTGVGWFLLLPLAFEQLGKSLVSVCLFSANIYFWRTFDYFGPSAGETPLLHCWSLAVEEQFYFIMPLVLVAVYWLFGKAGRRSQQVATVLIALAWFASIICSHILLTMGKQQAVFYLLPTRAWELLTGTLVAVIPISWIPAARWRRELLAIAGLVAILIPCFSYGEGTTFPGLLALPPCLGTAFIIVATSNHADSNTFTGKLLATAPMGGCGLISYSLYLWHWPIWIFAFYYAFEPPSMAFRLSAFVLSLITGWLSWKFVEQPFRSKTSSPSVQPTLRLAAGSIVFLLGVGAFLIVQDGVPNRFSDRVNKMLHVSDPWGDQSRYELVVDDIRSDRLIPISDRKDDHADILLWGDSHAIASMPAVEKLCRDNGLSAVAATHSSTLPIIDWIQPAYKVGLGKDAPQFNAAVLEYVRRRKVRNVLLVAAWQGCDSDEARTALLATVRSIVMAGAKPWFVTQVPRHPNPVPKALARVTIWGESETTYRATETPHPLYGLRGEENKFIAQLVDAGASVIEVRSAFWDPVSQSYAISADGRALYHDTNHITPFAARSVLAKVLEDAMRSDLMESKDTNEIRNPRDY